MKKKIVAGALVGIMALGLLSGCGNKQWADTTYTFNYAIIQTANGIVEGKVQSWRDYGDGDQLQVKINGKTYLVHSYNVTLIAE